MATRQTRSKGKVPEEPAASSGTAAPFRPPRKAKQPAAAAAAAKAQAVEDEKKLAKVFGEDGLPIEKKVGPTGEIFGSVTAADVAGLIKEHAGLTVEKKAITPPSIKSVGSGFAEVALHKEVSAKVKIVVTASI